jgi:AraC family transcriptional regulator
MKNNLSSSHDYLSDILGDSISTVKADWQNISVEEHSIPPGENPEMCVNKHIIGINVGQNVNMYMNLGGSAKTFHYLPGDLILVPAEAPVRANVDTLHNVSSFNLTKDLLSRNALEMWDIDKFELTPCFPIRDSLLQHLLQAIRHELVTNPDDCQVYAQTMANAIAVHLLKNFSNRSHRVTYVSGTLPKPQLKVILDYINDNLAEKISLEDLAVLIGCNQYYFSRAFKKSTGLSPHQYIIQQRVELAKQLLRQKKLSISEISLTCGFSHQSHLNRHFKRLVGTTPKMFQGS